MQTILFLCTGNYYRSRFAEALFNHLAAEAGLRWRANSAGLALERGTSNVGPLSQYAEFGLLRRGVRLSQPARMPRALTPADLEQATLIVAVDREEHQPLMAERFSTWADHITYWDIHDLDRSTSEVALKQLERRVTQLVDELGTRTVPEAADQIATR